MPEDEGHDLLCRRLCLCQTYAMREPGNAQKRIEELILREHEIVARRLRENPEAVLGKARENIERWGWLRDYPDPAHRPSYVGEWLRLLQGPVEDVLEVLTGNDEASVLLRSSSPFAGVVHYRERWALRKETTLPEGRDETSPA